mmetsp:Transcript_15616/g.31958  ORF Transcript_15616/g.31958 Transcript_15616/m.31958 type:complete len:634 (+) Transcript_15616:201-2102(+)
MKITSLLLLALCQHFRFLFFLSTLEHKSCTAFSLIDGNGIFKLRVQVPPIANQELGKEQNRRRVVAPRRLSSFALGAQKASGVRISNNSTYNVIDDDDSDTNSNNLETIKSLTKIAIYRCGTEEGFDALRTLHKLCDNRLSFDFDSFHRRQKSREIMSFNDTRNLAVDRGEQLISLLPGFLPTQTVDDFLESVRYMEEQGWMSTNPDSVDGLPSLHLNLVSHGKPLFGETLASCKNNQEDSSEEGKEDSFGSQIFKLFDLVRPYVYETLLPTVDRLLNTSNDPDAIHSKRKLRISDVFLRRYGQEVCGNMTRNGISIHYDVFSRVTAVVALDEVASKGDNGLFTLTDDEKTGETSNHKALRRFFPLRTGDCVVHTWDILHGVDVQPGLDRTSLIVWFDEVAEEGDGEAASPVHNKNNEYEMPPNSSWLSLEKQNYPSDATTLHNGNDVRQFVLASALSSVESDVDTELDEILLYLRSASRGNTFALTRMGSICEEGALSSSELQNESFKFLEELTPFEELPGIVQELLEENDNAQSELACRFWLEASLSGNPLAQKSLADEIMFEASRSGNPNQRLLAAVLFALASQQDNDEGPSDSLSRVIEYDLAARNIQSQEEFLASPVVQTANAAFGAA